MANITTREVLKTIAVGGLVVSAGVLPILPIVLSMMVKGWEQVNRKDLGRIIVRLQKQEMLSMQDHEGTVQIILSEKGQKHLLRYDFEHIERKATKRDGQWRLIFFDIPEESKRNRNLFVQKLKQLDCIRLQDSVYLSAFPCKTEIDFLCHYLEIDTYVTLVKVDSIERGQELIFKYFRVA